jgi:hypothetical protein
LVGVGYNIIKSAYSIEILEYADFLCKKLACMKGRWDSRNQSVFHLQEEFFPENAVEYFVSYYEIA